MRIKLPIILCIPVYFLMSISAGCGQLTGYKIPTAAENAKDMETKGIMTTSEYLKLNGIFSDNSLIPSVSDADINWLVHLLHTPPPTKGTLTRKRAAELRIAQISGFICSSAPLFKPQQENEIYPSAIWLCSSSDAVYRWGGVSMIGYFHDNSRGIPILLKLSKDSNADVRREAIDGLHRIYGARGAGQKS